LKDVGPRKRSSFLFVIEFDEDSVLSSIGNIMIVQTIILQHTCACHGLLRPLVLCQYLMIVKDVKQSIPVFYECVWMV